MRTRELLTCSALPGVHVDRDLQASFCSNSDVNNDVNSTLDSGSSRPLPAGALFCQAVPSPHPHHDDSAHESAMLGAMGSGTDDSRGARMTTATACGQALPSQVSCCMHML